MTRYKNDQSGITVVYFSDPETGMIFASVQGPNVQWGEDPSQGMQRCFTNHDRAVEWVKSKCRRKYERNDIDFLLEDGSPMVMVPRNQKVSNLKV